MNDPEHARTGTGAVEGSSQSPLFTPRPEPSDPGDGRNFAESGGLMTYGVDLDDQMRRAATYVDRILKGARPGDLPVQQPTKFQLVINLKTVKALGLAIPPSLLGRTDEIIQ
jgi:ABC-type uncharacterized transport system substrate-binding protein